MKDSTEKTATELLNAQLQAELVSRLESEIEELRNENAEKAEDLNKLKYEAINIMILTE